MDRNTPEGSDLVYRGPGGSSAPCTEPSIQWTWNVKEHCLAGFPVAVSGLELCDWPVGRSTTTSSQLPSSPGPAPKWALEQVSHEERCYHEQEAWTGRTGRGPGVWVCVCVHTVVYVCLCVHMWSRVPMCVCVCVSRHVGLCTLQTCTL